MFAALHSPVYLCICVVGVRVWGFRYVCGRVFCVRLIFSVLLSFTCAIVCGRSFLERVISTHFIRLLFVFAA